jgi:opacity protein-like surface antigen
MARNGRLPIGIFLLVLIGLVYPYRSAAEWYVGGQVGANFADRLTDIQGTGNLQSFSSPDFDLQNAVVYGGKLGYFPNNRSFGIELDAFNSTPHIKNLDNAPGIHMRVTNVGINVLLRYPGQTFQPYVGLGGGVLIARIGDSPPNGSVSDSDVGSAFNVLTGIRGFVTPYVAVFSEYKYTQGTLTFDRAFPPDGGFSGDYRAQHLVVGVSYHF